MLSLWYSYELFREEWPWILENGDKPAHVILTLEALAVLVALKWFFGDVAVDASPWTNRSDHGFFF